MCQDSLQYKVPTNVNHELVKEGWCWWYRKYSPEDVVLEELEMAARAAKRGLWVDPHPARPLEWRKPWKSSFLATFPQS